MSAVSRQKIFAQAARKLREDFEELSVIPHNALEGGEAEKLVRTFLKEHLPRRFDVGAGFIIDRLDNVSKQTTKLAVSLRLLRDRQFLRDEDNARAGLLFDEA